MSALIILLQTAVMLLSCDAQVLSDLLRVGMSPDDMKGLELYSDLTIDKIITQAMGGIDVSAQKMLSPDGMFLAELDMLLTEDQFRYMYEPPEYGDMKRMPYFEPKRRKKRKAIRRTNLRWNNAEMAYVFATGHFTDKEQYMIKVAMREWEKYTCLKFREANNEDLNYVRFQNGSGCNSQLGMVGGLQVLNLNIHGCRWKGLYLHEIGHAIGLVHEHQLPNRDNFIDIIYENVAPSMRIWFNKYSRQEVNQYDVDYEYSSVMHYGITAFAKDGKSQTIRAKDPLKEESIGKVWRKELAFSDVKAVNRMYECAAHCPKTVRCGGGGFLDQNCRCLCPDGTENCQIGKDVKFDDSCKNEYNEWSCHNWATQGECELNPKYMHKYCARACEVCSSTADEITDGNHVATWAWQWLGLFANLFPSDWSVGDCQDRYNEDKCHSWKENGDCVANEKWMKDNCKRTCGLCTQNETTTTASMDCENQHRNRTECDTWAMKGECQINKLWMSKNCKSSCHLCEIVVSDDPTDRRTDTGRRDDPRDRSKDGDSCSDKHNSRECIKWASQKECIKNPEWMIPNCRKSCLRCTDGSCKNLYDDKKCKLWARDHECAKNPDWMLVNCPKSCNTCFMVGNNDNGGDDDTSNDNDDDVDDDVVEDDRTTNNDDTVTTNDDDGRTGNDWSCQNDHDDRECDAWSASGHCDINPGYMKINCKRSCGQCEEVIDDDNDRTNTEDTNNDNNNDNNDDNNDNNNDNNNDDNSDDNNADEEEPDISPDRDEGEIDKPNRPMECIDEHEHCASWADAGYCRSNAAYSLRACKKSCKVCKSDCRDEHLFCVTWAKGNQCNNNAGYMLRFCQKSCNIC